MFSKDKKILTLMILMQMRENKQNILLGMKKQGFGMGKWNGFGGKVEKNEGIYNAAVREVKEECGLDVNKAQFIGLITFEYQIENKLPMHVHVFKTEDFTGDPIETSEMKPRWFEVDEIPYNQMWKDDELWYPYMFASKHFYGKFSFSDYDTILDYNLVEIKSAELFELQKRIVGLDI
jgi:8-oxo-dGTP pyrophosphatase MutT (NUDIX family)